MNVSAGQTFVVIYKNNYNIQGQYHVLQMAQGYIMAKAISNCVVTSDYQVIAWD